MSVQINMESLLGLRTFRKTTASKMRPPKLRLIHPIDAQADILIGMITREPLVVSVRQTLSSNESKMHLTEYLNLLQQHLVVRLRRCQQAVVKAGAVCANRKRKMFWYLHVRKLLQPQLCKR